MRDAPHAVRSRDQPGVRTHLVLLNSSTMNPWLFTIPLAYLLGSIPFGYLLVRFFRHEDIRATGSGNIGATNVVRSGAKGLGVLTLLLDLGKGSAAVVIAFVSAAHFATWAAEGPFIAHLQGFDLAVAAGVAVVVGHVFPVWLGFRGGKGVATALGVFLALSPALAGCIVVVFLLVFALTRYVSLASIVAATSVPLFALHFVHSAPPAVVFGFLFIPALVIVKHHANIRRLLAGTENRFGSRKAAA
jgi:glycerol-3-phosphate acyltransferase PlsY